MKVAFEAQRILRPTRYGMDIVALELLKELVKLNMDITLFSANGANRSDLPLIKQRAGGPSFYPLWEQIYLPSVLNEGFDIVHFSANTAPLKRRTKSILTLHDVIFLDPSYAKRGGSLYQRLGSKYREAIVNRVIHSCDKIVTVSHYEKQHIIDLTGIDQSRVEVIYNGVSSRFFTDYTESELDIFHEENQLPEKFMLFFGNSDGKKNSANTINAFLKWRREAGAECSLVVTNISDQQVDTLINPEYKVDTDNYLYTIPFIPHSKLSKLYHLAELYLYPSIAESFGLSILESMACGTPVITSNVTSMPEIGGESAFYVDPNSISSIASGIEQAVQSDSIEKRIKTGKDRAAQFTWRRAAQSYKSLYEQILLNN